MKKIHLFFTYCILVFGILSSCSEDDSEQKMSSDAYILKVEAKTDVGTIPLPIIGDNILINIPESVNLKTVSISIELSSGALISPEPSEIRDWSYKHTFTVTAQNGDMRTYYTLPQTENIGKEFYGSVRLSSQQEIDGFGSNGFSSVGDIYIFQGSGEDKITDFSALNSIKEIKGQLVINRVNCREVTFSNIERLGKLIFHAPAVTELRMPKLKSVADNLTLGVVEENSLPEPIADFTDIDFSSLEYVGGSLEFNYLTKLASLESLSNLSYIGKDLTLIGGYYSSLKGLEKIKRLNGTMTLSAEKTSLEGFNIEEIKGSLIVNNLESAPSLEPLSTLKHIEGELYLAGNLNVTSLKGIENIDVDYLSINFFYGLESLEGIPLKKEFGNLVLVTLPKVKSLQNLSSLKKITHSLRIVELAQLTDLQGLENLVATGNLIIQHNLGLTKFNGLSNNLEINGYLDVTNCPKITDLEGLEALTSLGGLRLRSLEGLTSLKGLENITNITLGGVFVENNNTLTDISALAKLQDINFYQQSDKMVFNRNRNLTDFCPISSLLQRYLPIDRVVLSGNAYNPNVTDFVEGRCSVDIK
ncbi:MAG: hypothetical protein ACK5L5_01795 [Bacteroidales bacterium]